MPIRAAHSYLAAPSRHVTGPSGRLLAAFLLVGAASGCNHPVAAAAGDSGQTGGGSGVGDDAADDTTDTTDTAPTPADDGALSSGSDDATTDAPDDTTTGSGSSDATTGTNADASPDAADAAGDASTRDAPGGGPGDATSSGPGDAGADGSGDTGLPDAPSDASTGGLDGGACTASTCSGTCQPDGRCLVVMADHQVLTTDVAVDDVNVYWTEVGPSDAGATVNGNVKSLPKTSTGGGIPTTLASGQDYPEAIAVNASAAYWVNSNGQTVQKVGLDGGAPVVLAMFQNGVNALAIDDTSVYWTNYAGSVATTPLGGGTVATIGGALSPWGLAVGSGTVYWVSYVNTNYTSLNLYARPPDGGAVATMGSVSNLGNPQRRGVATDSTYVYFSGEYLYRVPIAGGAVTTIAMSPIWPNDIAVDDQNVYWTAGASNWGMVARAPLAGGATTTLATNQPYPGGIAVDGTSVYWVNGGTNTSLSTDGTVMKLTPK